MTEIRDIVCIRCPNGCAITYTHEGDIVLAIENALCSQGEKFVEDELSNPGQIVTTSVYVKNGKAPIISVKTTSQIPRSLIEGAMEAISKMEISAPVKFGQIISKNFLGTGTDLVTTKGVAQCNGEN